MLAANIDLSLDKGMPTTVSSEPEPVKLEPDEAKALAGELQAQSSNRVGVQNGISALLPAGIKRKFAELFAADLRSLAITRIVAALLVLTDLTLRFSSITAFYSDKGVLPRVALYEKFPNAWSVSLHLMNGRTEIQALLFVISGVFAVMLLLGYRTRWASFFTWLLFSSLNARNPYVAHGGDALLNMLLFWGMFVPWGAKYSVDHALDVSANEHPQRVVSIGTAALLLMMPFVYFFSGMLKTGPEWRDEFTAIYYVLSAPEYATVLGRWMATWPMLALQALTVSVVVLELGGSLLLFSPFANRTIRALVLPAFLLLQIGLALTLNLGLFPLISTAAMLPFISSRFWDNSFRRLPTPSRRAVRIYYDGSCDFCRKAALLIKEFCLAPNAFVQPAQSNPEIHGDMKRHNSWVVIDEQERFHYKFEALVYILRQSPVFWLAGVTLSWRPLAGAGQFLYERAANSRPFLSLLTRPLSYRPLHIKQPLIFSLLCAAILVYVVVDNLGSVKRAHVSVPERLRGVGQLLKINQRWRMFAPSPLRNYEWFFVEGRLHDGQQFCMVNGIYAPCDQSRSTIPSFQSYRWRTYWRFMGSDSEKHLRPYLASYVCEMWNSRYRDKNPVDQVVIYKMQQPIQTESTTDAQKKIELWTHQCSGGMRK